MCERKYIVHEYRWNFSRRTATLCVRMIIHTRNERYVEEKENESVHVCVRLSVCVYVCVRVYMRD